MVISSSSKVTLLFHRQTGAEYINLIRQWADSRLSCSSCKSTFIASSYSLALQKFQLNFSSSVGSEFQFLSPQSWDVTSEFFFFFCSSTGFFLASFPFHFNNSASVGRESHHVSGCLLGDYFFMRILASEVLDNSCQSWL